MDIRPPPDKYVQQTFAADGWLSQVMSRYSPRAGQITMAEAVDWAFREHKSLVAEAPTGVGKSMAYLVPASYHAAANNKRTLIVTANIALQEQLIKKDLPIVAASVPWGFTFDIYKGRSNYLCLHRLEQARRHEWKNPSDEEEAQQIYKWTPDTKTGDSSELDFQPSPGVWGRFSVTGEECIDKCRYSEKCFANRAYKSTHDSQVLVTNYHMLLADVVNEKRVLPQYNYLVLDEGHKAVDIARDFFGFVISELSIYRLLQPMLVEVRSITGNQSKKSEKSAAEAAMDAARLFFAEAETFRRSGKYKIRLRTSPKLPYQPLMLLLAKVEMQYRELGRMAAGDELKGEYKSLADMVKKKCEQLNEVAFLGTLDQHKTCNFVYYLEEDKGGKAKICSKMFDVANHLDKHLFMHLDGLVVTSATLSVEDSFDYTVRALGVRDASSLVVESPFDWSTQARLIVPQKFPEPKDQLYRTAVGDALVEIIQLAKGRTMVLFTSWAGLDHAYNRLKSDSKLSAYSILKQGDAPRTKLLDLFRRNVSSVLLGVESFWQGVDVQGESLSCLVIDKLPFPTPDDPILDVMEEYTEGHAFSTYSIPKAVLALKQGFGRLIRSGTDKGVVIILDKRIHTKWDVYGRLFVRSLPANLPKGIHLSDISKVLT